MEDVNDIFLSGYNNIHENLAKIELEALTLLEVVQSSEGGISGKVEKEGDKIAALEISENLLWLQVTLPLDLDPSFEKL